MDDLFNDILGQCSSALKLEEIPIPPELARTKYPFGILDLVCRNWRAAPLRKIYSMRAKIRVPRLDILGMAFHPEPCYDIPIFLFDLSCTSKKIVTYINVFAALDDPSYYETYMKPFEQLARRYAHFQPFEMPEWMQYYRSACTIYSHPESVCLDELKACVRQYFSLYLPMLESAKKISDPMRAEAVQRFHARMVSDVLTKDGSRIMLGRAIGQKKASRLFQEVLT